MQVPAELDTAVLQPAWRAASCGVPPEKILTKLQKKSKQPKVLTNRVTESLPIDIVHCKQTSNNGTFFFFFWFR